MAAECVRSRVPPRRCHHWRALPDRYRRDTLLLGFAVVIGSAVGLSVIGFYKLIDLAQAVSLTAVGRMTGIGSLSIVLVVLAGVGLTRTLVRYGTGDSDGENLPEVMRAVAKRGGVIHAGPVEVKSRSRR